MLSEKINNLDMSVSEVAPKKLSPCISVCKTDEALGLCIGCYRTPDEIATWKASSEASQYEILKDLPLRRKKILREMYQGRDIKESYKIG